MQNGGQRNCQGRDVGQRIEVRRAVSVTHQQPFLPCGFKAGIRGEALTLEDFAKLANVFSEK